MKRDTVRLLVMTEEPLLAEALARLVQPLDDIVLVGVVPNLEELAAAADRSGCSIIKFHAFATIFWTFTLAQAQYRLHLCAGSG